MSTRTGPASPMLIAKSLPLEWRAEQRDDRLNPVPPARGLYSMVCLRDA